MSEKRGSKLKLLKKTDSAYVASVIFADFSTAKFNYISEWLRKENIHTEAVTDPAKFLKRIEQEHVSVAVVNLLLGGIGPFELISSVREHSLNPDIKVIVISRQVHRVNIQNTIRAGANDFIGEPFQNEGLFHRILYHLSPKKEISLENWDFEANKVRSEKWLNLLLWTLETLSRTTQEKRHESFCEILKKTATLLGSNRTSVVMVDVEKEAGVVMASSDDPNFYDYPLALVNYPEIMHVIHTGQFVLIDNVSAHALTKDLEAKVRTIKIGSLMVFPIWYQGLIIGVMTVRIPSAMDIPSREVISLLQAIANSMAAHANVNVMLRRIYNEYNAK